MRRTTSNMAVVLPVQRGPTNNDDVLGMIEAVVNVLGAIFF
jgi:hypothetical protein